jgi:hypothetical protein
MESYDQHVKELLKLYRKNENGDSVTVLLQLSFQQRKAEFHSDVNEEMDVKEMLLLRCPHLLHFNRVCFLS